MKKILLVETCKINCFFSLIKTLENYGFTVSYCNDVAELPSLLANNSFQAVMLSLEPDGEGGIQGVDCLDAVINSDNQQSAVCFSVSTSSAAALLTTKPDYLPQLSVIAGWLNLPINAEKACKVLGEIINIPGDLAIGNRLNKKAN